ncbi:trace amine-associated receptor 13c-like [Anabas testudineus]|uniref:trace amine-associated receptor 13c-like n=1 Tax=Anabas testudineus TaxID=64144 RepID=UPI000E45BBD0|nr:trace amine-associated receptor 13c-like [Anabas testudineus]
METLEEADLCFPQLNTSCRKTMHASSEAVLILSLESIVAILTVVLNLLVIISISYFRQLHTNTNLLVLSLAVADFLVGLLQMPIEIILNQGCWLLSDFMCTVNAFLSYFLVSVSVGNLVLISVDRYVAICDPMFYYTKVTLNRVQICICLCWVFSAVHSSWILRDFVKQQNQYDFCYGEQIVTITYAQVAVDFVVTFLGPFLVITLLYLRVFVVAVSQARAMRSHITAVTLQRSQTVKPKKSEIKAARTLGIVIFVFLLCSSPYYFFSVGSGNISTAGTSAAIWLLYCNSCLNPVIYTFFYSWFRKAIKHIFTLQILQPESREANIL